MRTTMIKDALDGVRRKNVPHAKQIRARDDVAFLLECCPNVQVVALIGPSGTGKTTTAKAIKADIEQALGYHADNEGLPSADRPVIYTSAIATGFRKFSWKLLYRSALRQLGDPFADKRPIAKAARVATSRLPGEGMSETELRVDIEDELRLRGTRVWIIDEAQHMLMGGSSGAPGDQYDVVKSIAERTGCKILLVGTAVLATFIPSSTQLSRRSEYVRMERYDVDDPEQLNEFRDAVLALLKRLPVDSFPDVNASMRLLYGGSLGCVGHAADWTERAFAKAMREGTKDLTEAHLVATRHSSAKLKRFALEIAESERVEDEVSVDELLDIARGKVLIDVMDAGEHARQGVRVDPSKAKEVKPRTGKPKPGTRALGRDPVPPVDRHGAQLT